MGGSRAREVKGIANLGPIDIIWETLKIYWSHAKFFLIIQLTIVLPIAILGIIEQFILAEVQSGSKFPPASPPSFAPVTAGSTNGGNVLLRSRHYFHIRADDPLAPDPASPAQILGLGIVAAIVGQALNAVWICAVLYAVGLIYIGNSVSFLDVLHKIPRLWKRLMVTLLWQLLLVVGIVLVETIFGIGIYYFLGLSQYSVYIFLVLWFLFFGVMVGIGIVSEIAQSVSVLDDSYGWAALKKSCKLLKGTRSWVALGVTILLGIPGMTFAFLIMRITTQFSIDPWNPLMWLAVVVYAFGLSFLCELSCVSYGVMYISFKAYHGENIGDSNFFNQMVTKDIDEHNQSLLSGTENEP